MAVSFAARVGQGAIAGSEMARHLPDDFMLIIHLTAALCYTVGSGAFALSLAYERRARELQQAAMRDSLSGLFNRGAFEQHVREQLASTERQELAIVFFDIDNFKLFNDRFGHAAGDEAIRQCARACADGMRETDFIARIGGEEFAAILTDVTAEEAFGVVERIRLAVASMPISAGGATQSMTISAGICHSASGFRDFDELLQMADRGLYRAKHLGRNRVEQIAA
jgi:diguanylate cyclase (GGDEF)-like protein